MPTKLDGGQRTDAFNFAEPEEKILLGRNISRSDLGTPGELEQFAQKINKEGQLEAGLVRKDAQGRSVLFIGFRRYHVITNIINKDLARFGRQKPMQFRAEYRNVTEKEALRLQLSENINRKDLTAIDRAFAARDLMQDGWTLEEVAESLNCSTSRIPQLLDLIRLPEDVRLMIHRGEMPEVTGRSMLDLPEEDIAEATQAVKGGEKPARVAERVKAKKRDAGSRQARTLPELRAALRNCIADQAVLLLAYIDGEPGLSFDMIEWGPVEGVAAQEWMEARAHGELEEVA